MRYAAMGSIRAFLIAAYRILSEMESVYANFHYAIK